MAQYPKIESIGSIGSIILAILEVQAGMEWTGRSYWDFGGLGVVVHMRFCVSSSTGESGWAWV